jgi:hypothetical protein
MLPANLDISTTCCSKELHAAPIVRFSEFMGIGYFGDSGQHVVAPIFDQRGNAVGAWAKVTESQKQKVPSFHIVFVEHASKYEIVAYPVSLLPEQINYALYRSFSSLDSMRKFQQSHGGRIYLKFGWHDLTKQQKFDVLTEYASVDSVEFLKLEQVKEGSTVDTIRKNK